MKNQSNIPMFPADFDDLIFQSLKTAINSGLTEPKVLNRRRFHEMSAAKEALESILKGCDEDVEVSIHYYRAFSSAGLSYDMDFLEVYDMEKFYSAMKYANNFEVLPLINGKIRLSFMFRNMFITIKEEK